MRALKRPRPAMAGRRDLEARPGRPSRMLELAAESGCTMLSIGFQIDFPQRPSKACTSMSIGPKPSSPWSKSCTPTGSWCSACSCTGFDGDDTSVFDETVELQHQRQIRRLCLFGVDAVSGHADVVRDEEGEPYRLL